MSRVLKMGVVVLVLLAIAASTASAQEVSRSFDKDPVRPGQTVKVTLSATPGLLGAQVNETYPPGFTFVNWTYSGANSVKFSQSGNTLVFTVTDLSSDGFTITYTLQAPATEGTYTFTGTYSGFNGTGAQFSGNIAGDSVLSVSNVTITTEKLSNPVVLNATAPYSDAKLTIGYDTGVTSYIATNAKDLYMQYEEDKMLDLEVTSPHDADYYEIQIYNALTGERVKYNALNGERVNVDNTTWRFSANVREPEIEMPEPGQYWIVVTWYEKTSSESMTKITAIDTSDSATFSIYVPDPSDPSKPKYYIKEALYIAPYTEIAKENVVLVSGTTKVTIKYPDLFDPVTGYIKYTYYPGAQIMISSEIGSEEVNITWLGANLSALRQEILKLSNGVIDIDDTSTYNVSVAGYTFKKRVVVYSELVVRAEMISLVNGTNYVKITSYDEFDASAGRLVFYTSENTEKTLDISVYVPTDGQAILQIGKKTYTSSTGLFSIDINDIGVGRYPINIVVKDRWGTTVFQVNLSNSGATNASNWSFDSPRSLKGKSLKMLPNGIYLYVVRLLEQPTVSITIPKKVVFGDILSVTVNINNRPKSVCAYWYIGGPYYGEYNVTVHSGTRRVCTDTIPLSIDTGKLKYSYGALEGDYKFVVMLINTTTGQTVEVKWEEFKLVDPTVSGSVCPSTPFIGQKIKISGMTNVANTAGTYDTNVLNKVTVQLLDADGNFVVLDPTSKATTVQVNVKDGTWELPSPVYLTPTLPAGNYELRVSVVTAVLPDGSTIGDSDTIYFNVNEPEITITMPLTYVNGEKITFEGETTLLSEYQYTWLFITPVTSDTTTWSNLIEEFTPANVTTVSSYDDIVKAYSDGKFVQLFGNDIGVLGAINAVDGKFMSPSYHIDQNAPRASYRFDVRVVYWDRTTSSIIMLPYSTSLTIKVVTAKIDVVLDPNTVVRGGNFKLTAYADRDVIYVFADEKGVIKGVPEIPSDTTPFTANANGVLSTGERLFAVNGEKTDDGRYKFEVLLRTNESADADTYLIYVIQPNDRTGRTFDPSVDAMGIATLTLEEFGIEKIVGLEGGNKFVMAQGDERDLIIKVRGDPDDMHVEVKVTSNNLDVTMDAMKLNESADGNSGYVFATLYTFYDRATKSLIPRIINRQTQTFLGPDMDQGDSVTYKLKITLEDRNGDEVDTEEIYWVVERVKLKIDYEPPSLVVPKGQDLVLHISSNHKSDTYSDVHVVLESKGKLYKFLNIMLENGKANVTIPTSMLDEDQTYTLYVRDRAGTAFGWVWEQHYKYRPLGTGEYDYGTLANIGANDDFVEPKEVKVVSAAVTATATTTTTTTTATATTTTTTTTTTATATTTTTTTTTTEQGGGGIPGFEAVFAIAGLLAVAYLLRRH